MIWFLVVLIHSAACSKCGDVPSATIKMPSLEVCVQVKKDNPDVPLDCWAKPQ